VRAKTCSKNIAAKQKCAMKLFEIEREDVINLSLELPLTGIKRKEFPNQLMDALNGKPANDFELASAIAIYKSPGKVKDIQLTTKLASRLPITVTLLALHNIKVTIHKQYFEQLPLFSSPDTAVLNGSILSLLYAINTESMDKVLDIWSKNHLSFTTMLMVPPTLLVSSASWMVDRIEYFWDMRPSLPYLARVSLFYLLWDQVFDSDSPSWKGELGYLLKQNPAFVKYWKSIRNDQPRTDAMLILADKFGSGTQARKYLELMSPKTKANDAHQ